MSNAELFVEWFRKRGIDPPIVPEDSGLFLQYTTECVLPYVLGYCESTSNGKTDRGSAGDGPPDWQSETWVRRGKGWTRLFRADQLLDWLASVFDPDSSRRKFRRALVRLLHCGWLVPLDDSLALRRRLAERRVEVVRFFVGPEHFHCSRRPDWLPDVLREPLAGLDPVHTPENARAGLTRYLCEGWEIGDDGQLVPSKTAKPWGPVTVTNRHRLHDAPRRLMLGASLQSRSVPLSAHAGPDGTPPSEVPLTPLGVELDVVFSAHGGWTHEDAVVISESAARKLVRNDRFHVRFLIPAVCTRVELAQEGQRIQKGAPLVRAYVDLLALGYRLHAARKLGASDGWLEVAIPQAELGDEVVVLKVVRHPLRPLQGRELAELLRRRELMSLPRWRELVEFQLQRVRPLQVGDKLATPHGVKGVVSRILPDDQMPVAGERRAEIVLSPVGIAKRLALGQFREAAPEAEDLPRAGRILVMRQPQDAAPRCRVCGPEPGPARGQRYGEMEFWALMAHGAGRVARELLSVKRSTATWIHRYAAGSGSTSAQTAVTQALNHFFSVVGAEIRRGGRLAGPTREQMRESRDEIVVRARKDAFEISLENDPRKSDITAIFDALEDESRFENHGGLGFIPLGEPVTVDLPDGRGSESSRCHRFVFHAIHVIPPWLRPRIRGPASPHHPLTAAYAELIHALREAKWTKNPKRLPGLVKRCVRDVLGDRFGAGRFLRREVLGRRLNRSARAVIVPRPDLRIDQISIPENVLEAIFEGLPEANRRLVLVNRNPTLHRFGLLALRPVPDRSGAAVFGLPLGVLNGMGADFDGDQVAIVALETESAIEEAERLLLPGSERLRIDDFRHRMPAFRLCKELSDLDRELALAEDSEADQDQWCHRHHRLVQQRIAEVGDGWEKALADCEEERFRKFWKGLDEATWFQYAEEEMQAVYLSVRRKGRLGGVFRRYFYQQPFVDAESFRRAICAMQAVTERLAQSALSVKTGEGGSEFPYDRFFRDPKNPQCEAWLYELDKTLSYPAIRECLAPPVSNGPTGLLGWLAKPTFENLLARLADVDEAASPGDPRIRWFFG